MYFNEHNPPHFHAQYNEYEALIDIQKISLYQWNLPPRVLWLVLERATLHQKELLHNRTLMEQQAELQKIEPLT